jgi:tRNA1(Val) A37 N6-methylase TrmN6
MATRPEPGPGETLDRLGGDWRVFQLERGHRYATDDVLVAWTGLQTRPDARRLLDLGSGVGSVGLLALLRMAPTARLTSVEVQEVSVGLMRKTVAFNGLEERVEIVHGDLRDAGLVDGAGRFDLVLANPPYLPPERAMASPNPQRAGARLELNGDVFDYCAAAARHLAPEGRFCFCHAAADPRPEQAIEASGLALLARQDVIFRHGRPPMIALYTCSGEGGARSDLPVIEVRTADGSRSEAYASVRRELLIED